MTELTAQMATDFVHQVVPAVGRLGITVQSVGPGTVTLRAPIEGNANHMGTMYAGVLVALAELPGGLLPLGVLDPTKYIPIVTAMEVQFTAAARTDVTLSASMEPADLRALGERVESEGRAEFTLDLHGEDANGRTVISSVGHYLLRPSRG
ncbi:MAG: YiiD C-terminal domain-containing protein [Candidatus Nanopelagicales bacterium]